MVQKPYETGSEAANFSELNNRQPLFRPFDGLHGGKFSAAQTPE